MSKSKKAGLNIDFSDLKKTLDAIATNTTVITLKGRIPSKKNSRNLFVRGGRLMNIPSKNYVKWHQDAIEQLREVPRNKLKDIDRVTLSFWAPDKRATDLTNKAESVMDLLVDASIIEDDNWFIVNSLELEFKGTDKDNPRCEIYITQKTKDD